MRRVAASEPCLLFAGLVSLRLTAEEKEDVEGNCEWPLPQTDCRSVSCSSPFKVFPERVISPGLDRDATES